MLQLTRRLSLAYWPRPEKNESADRVAGNAVVDSLTLGELLQFFSETTCGPTYCMVRERVEVMLKEFPPFIEKRRQEALNALEAAKYAFTKLKNVVEQV